MYHPASHGHDHSRDRRRGPGPVARGSPRRATALLVGAVGGDASGPRLSLHRVAAGLPGKHRGWTHSFSCCRFWRSRSRSSARLFASGLAAGHALALLRGRDRLAHRLRLDHVASGRCSSRPFPRALLPGLGLHPRSLLHRDLLVTLVLCLIRRDRGARARPRSRSGPRLLSPTSGSARPACPRPRGLEGASTAPPPGPRGRAAAVSVAVPLARPDRARRGGRTSRSSTSGRSRAASTTPRAPEKWSEIVASLSDFYPPPGARAGPALRSGPGLADSRRGARAARDCASTWRSRGSPSRRCTAEDGGAEVVVQDLRFLPWFAGPWERGGKGGIRRQPFVYRVRFDAARRAVERGFVRGGRQ